MAPSGARVPRAPSMHCLDVANRLALDVPVRWPFQSHERGARRTPSAGSLRTGGDAGYAAEGRISRQEEELYKELVQSTASGQSGDVGLRTRIF